MKNTLLSIGVVVAVVISCIGLIKNTNIKVDDNSIVARILEKIGAMPGPDMYVPYLSVNGVRKYYESMDTRLGTSTLCVFPAPSATTTLEYLSVGEIGTSTAMFITFAQATDPYSTTTQIGTTYEIQDTQAETIIASSTISTESRTPYMITPTVGTTSPNYIVVGIQGSGGDSSAIQGSEDFGYQGATGTCAIILQEI